MFPDLSNDDEPPSILSDKVKRGELGMKAEMGFWNWDQEIDTCGSRPIRHKTQSRNQSADGQLNPTF